MVCIGALPFLSDARASELTYGAQARVQSSYLWRGLYAGGPNIQASANVGYYGVYADVWWNIGATDIRFSTFEPEVDLTVGFSRWGLNAYLLYIHNFNCGFFDGTNYPDRGNRLEVNVSYTISDKIPLTFLWATRVGASDGYVNAQGEVVRAYSSYAEISYNQPLRNGFSLYGAIGMTPWRSCYTGYQRGAALQNIEVRVRKDWQVGKRTGLMLQGQIAVCPSAPINVINLNAAFGVYLK